MQLFPAIYTKTPTRMSGLRGYVTASFGRALEWHSRGQRFDPAYLHHRHREVAKGNLEAKNGFKVFLFYIAYQKRSYARPFKQFMVLAAASKK